VKPPCFKRLILEILSRIRLSGAATAVELKAKTLRMESNGY